jgi:hypothetical protein
LTSRDEGPTLSETAGRSRALPPMVFPSRVRRRREACAAMSRGELAVRVWRRLCCCARGHDYAVASAQSRMFLRCRACGRTSRGLDLAEKPFARRTDASRAAGMRAAGGHTHPAVR